MWRRWSRYVSSATPKFRLRTRLARSSSGGAATVGVHSPTNEGESAGGNERPVESYAARVLGVATLGAFCYFCKERFEDGTALALAPTEASRAGEFRENLPTYTAEQVGKRDGQKGGVWITYKRGVYDITKFVSQHPGGESKIMMAAGSSIEPFWQIFANHDRPEIRELLETMRIGNLAESPADDPATGDSAADPYGDEPERDEALAINGHRPFCAEPPPAELVQSFLTPAHLYYVRNHLPVPRLDARNYEIEIAMEDETKRILDYETIVSAYPKYTITSTIMCGGNRRSEMAKAKPLRGLSWGIGAVGNSTWSGARLCDVLKDLDINEDDWNHVQFEGSDVDPAGVAYGASIPISKALDPKGDVLLAYEMNGQPISRDHGYPIRVIVPGVVGARNVKWLTKITVSKEESHSQWQRNDYKGFSPSVDWDTVDFSKAPAIQEMPVISAICIPEDGQRVRPKDGKIFIKGYAWSGGGRGIIRVDVTIDAGKTWHVADLVARDETAKEGRHWAWTIWSAEISVDESVEQVEIWAKAVDSSYNVQPESFDNIWNLRGFLCNAYHRVRVRLEK